MSVPRLQSVVMLLLVMCLLAAPAWAATLADVRQRVVLRCGVEVAPGLAWQDASGAWRGFDADICRAVAAAVLGDVRRVRFVPLTAEDAPRALRQNRVDMLARAPQDWRIATAGRYVVPRVSYYDGIGILAPRALRLSGLGDLDGARVCVHMAAVPALDALAADRRLALKTTIYTAMGDMQRAYGTDRCDAVAAPYAWLTGMRGMLEQPTAHMLLADSLGRYPTGPAGRDDDPRWAQILALSVDTLIWGEALGLTQNGLWPVTDATQRLQTGRNGVCAGLGLHPRCATRILRATGHYGEVFARHFNAARRGPNRLSRDGGVLYAPSQ